jgi:predicted MFS family arabinose efflux permease
VVPDRVAPLVAVAILGVAALLVWRRADPGRPWDAAVVMSGISIATVVGIPLGTVLEELTDWRTTFLIWAGLSALVLACVASAVPSLPSNNAVSVREVFTLPLRNPQLRVVLIIVILFVLGHFGAYTYVRPFLEHGQFGTPVFITIVLMIFGIGGAVGNFVAGHTVNKSLNGSFILGCIGLVLSLLLLIIASDQLIVTITAMILWGVSFGVVQTRHPCSRAAVVWLKTCSALSWMWRAPARARAFIRSSRGALDGPSTRRSSGAQ